MNTSERSMRLRLAAHQSWANTMDRAGRTAAARRASHHTRFIEQARRENPAATDEQLRQIAESLKSAHYTALALKSAQARRIKRELANEEKRRRIAAELAAYTSRATA
jgi:translation initiation factor 2B subunit (eIF-2B alpha/beta/delta family)